MATPNREQSTYGKTNLIDDVTASTQGYSRRQVAEIVDATLKAITDKVRTGQNVTVTGFGTFRRTERAARRGTNIRTHEPINIPAQSTVRFTPGSELKAAVVVAQRPAAVLRAFSSASVVSRLLDASSTANKA